MRLCITDFGLARTHEADPSLSGKSLVAGTPDYMAPELYEGRPPSQASDLFAFGVVLHEVFTGQKPMVARIARGDRQSAIEFLRGAFYCTQFIVGCLDRDPERRCQAFERILDSLHINYRTKQLWTRRRFAALQLRPSLPWRAPHGGNGMKWKMSCVHCLGKRFVALLNWPKTSDIHVTPMLTSVLGAIKS